MTSVSQSARQPAIRRNRALFSCVPFVVLLANAAIFPACAATLPATNENSTEIEAKRAEIDSSTISASEIPSSANSENLVAQNANSASANSENTAQNVTNVAENSASNREQKVASFLAGKGTVLYLASGLAMPFADNEPHATQRSLRTADTLLTASLVTAGLKRVFREKRLDSDARDSFPSQHATAAFAVATMASHYRPNQAPFWYLGATLISASRVKLRRHRVRDVVAGAAIGFATAKIEVRQSRGLLLFPFIKADGARRSKSSGFAIGGHF